LPYGNVFNVYLGYVVSITTFVLAQDDGYLHWSRWRLSKASGIMPVLVGFHLATSSLCSLVGQA